MDLKQSLSQKMAAIKAKYEQEARPLEAEYQRQEREQLDLEGIS